MASTKHTFWQALIVTIAVFLIGIFIGIAIESSRVDRIEDYYAVSEISLMDIMALNTLMDDGNFSCQELLFTNLEFADRVYDEAIILEDYENSGKLTDDFKVLHKKYDLLRTFLWMNSEKARSQCKGDFSIVVYLYEQENEDLAQKATQNVWSKILFELKQRKGADIVLIPLAVDTEIASLDLMVSKYDIDNYPVVIVNNQVIDELKSVEELEALT